MLRCWYDIVNCHHHSLSLVYILILILVMNMYVNVWIVHVYIRAGSWITYMDIYIYTDGLKVRMTFRERAEGTKTMHEYMKRHILTLRLRPDCDLQLECPPQSLMQEWEKQSKPPFSHVFQKIIVHLECATPPPKLPNVKSDSLVRNGRTMFIHLSVAVHSRTASHSEMAGHRRPC